MTTFDILLKEYCNTSGKHWIDIFSTPNFLLFCAEALKTTPKDVSLNNEFKKWSLDRAEDAYFFYGVSR